MKISRDNLEAYLIYLRSGLFSVLIVAILSGLLGKYLIPEVLDLLFSLIATVNNVDFIVLDNILATFTNPKSAIIYVIMIFFMSFLIVAEYGMMIIISNRAYLNIKFTFKDVFIDLINGFKKILNVKSLKYFLAFYLVSPIIGVGLSANVVGSISISHTIISFILSSPVLVLIYLVISIIGFMFLCRLSFTLHEAFLSEEIINSRIKENLEIGDIKLYLKNKNSIQIMMAIFILVNVIYTFAGEYIINELLVDTITQTSNLDILELALVLGYFILVAVKKMIPFVFCFHLTYLMFNSYGVKSLKSKKNINIGVLILIAIISFFINSKYIDIGQTVGNQVMVHRGGGYNSFENSKEAIELAVARNYSSIEIDVMQTKDEKIILCHDKNLLRLTGQDLNVYDLNYDEIIEYSLVAENDDDDDDGNIEEAEKNEEYNFISLEEAIELCGDNIYMNIEIKTHGYETDSFIEDITEVIESNEYYENSVVSSFDYDILLDIENTDSRVDTVLISYFFLGNLQNLKVDGISLDIRYTIFDHINVFRENGKKVMLWTANKPSDIVRALSLDSDYLITDEAELVENLKDSFDFLDNLFDTLL